MRTSSLLALLAACADPTATVGRRPHEPAMVAYTSFDGAPMQRQAWTGNRLAFLLVPGVRDSSAMRELVATFDSVDAYFEAMTGRRPAPFRTLHGRTTIAQVPTTCGAGCAYLGATGIELQNDFFELLYSGVRRQGEYDQVLFYEFGRNYWFWSPQIAYKEQAAAGVVPTGYAVFMRFLAMDAAGVTPAPFNGSVPFSYFRAQVEELLERYLADEMATWYSTLGAGRAPVNPLGLGATDLFASFLFRLRRDYGGDPFIARLWREVAALPAAGTTQEAVDNFVHAAGAAAGEDLKPLFVAWKWP